MNDIDSGLELHKACLCLFYFFIHILSILASKFLLTKIGNFHFLHRIERMLNEMLSHLERQPRNKDRRIAWLKFIEPLLSAVGLVLLANFRRMFPLFFKWMHSDDDETVLLVRMMHLPFQ